MSLEELVAAIARHNIPAFAYSLGTDDDESYCLVGEADGWHVYYSERGNRNSERVFTSESEACEDLLRRLLNDGGLRAWIADRQPERE